MKAKIKKLLAGLLVLLAIFAMGITVLMLWVKPRFRTVSTPGTVKVSEGSKDERVWVPNEWKKLDIKNRVTMRLPEDMQPSEPLGDSFAYREQYTNRDIKLIISYGSPIPPRPNQSGKQFDPCDTPSSQLEESTYHESVIDIDGRKVKLSIDRYYQPHYILAGVCFLNPGDSSQQLVVWANCKDDRALETAQQIFNSIRLKDSN